MIAFLGQRTEFAVRAACSPHPRFAAFLLLAAAAVAAINLSRLVLHLFTRELIPPYKATLYWVDYGGGFVRRGLPGEALSWLTGGSPSYAAMLAAGLLLSATACGAVVLLARRLCQLAAPETRLAVAVVALAPPLTLPLMARDLGRYDAVGVVAIAAIALLPRRWPWSTWTAAGASSAVVAVACASEEFLGAYLAPVVLLSAYQLAGRQARRALALAGVMLLPGVLISVASLAVVPDDRLIQSGLDAAHAAGVGPSTPTGNDAATLLGATLDEQFALFDSYSTAAIATIPVLLGGLFLLLAWTLWALLGRPVPRLAMAVAAWLVFVAVALSVVGVDFLRWWALALVAFVGCLVAAEPGGAAPGGFLTMRMRLLIGALVLACVLCQDVPIAPPPA